jgi:hypothetical protein
LPARLDIEFPRRRSARPAHRSNVGLGLRERGGEVGHAVDDGDDEAEEEEEEEKEFNLDWIISGLATLAGPCGTHAVAADKPVVVQPSDPRAAVRVGEDGKEASGEATARPSSPAGCGGSSSTGGAGAGPAGTSTRPCRRHCRNPDPGR